jgi:hypothetical protein
MEAGPDLTMTWWSAMRARRQIAHDGQVPFARAIEIGMTP